MVNLFLPRVHSQVCVRHDCHFRMEKRVYHPSTYLKGGRFLWAIVVDSYHSYASILSQFHSTLVRIYMMVGDSKAACPRDVEA